MNKNMAANVNASVIGNDVWTTMEEDAASNGNFYTPEVGKINQVMIITDPIRGMTDYKKQVEQRVQYQMFVAPVENGRPGDAKVWGVKAKSALIQIVAIVKNQRLTSLVGATLQVVVTPKTGSTGTAFKDYTILLVQAPTPQIVTQIAQMYPGEKLKEVGPKLFEQMAGATPAPVPQQPIDQGVQWIEQQKAGMTAAQGAPAGGH